MFVLLLILQQLFDSLYAMLVEESLLVRTVETTHLNDCQNVRVAAHRIHSFYEKFVPIIQKSKVHIYIPNCVSLAISC